MVIGIIIAVVVILAIYIIATYNKFVTLKNQAEEAVSQIDAHLKQRYDLVPNLVETVKGYAAHEAGTLEAVIKARNAGMNAQTLAEKDQAAAGLTGALKSLFALSESYPDLKANEGFVNLQNQLKELETEILSARKYYNAVVKTFNTATQVFPGSLVAGLFGAKFPKLEYLQIEDEARQNVKVKF
ncbi:MAG: LemA family protein [Sphaerochaetaceae bacterium]|nr:LemA family protein [Sphaerochaetaceae bacterium]MDD3163320.1 LemA family protein [Sphaerochaetaceae bacterium]MDD4007430.1 LemA family protein [Sphaerochaetaceae bacterium]MDD4396593.1 LemA family protein [Sphaerochaetaceae bacterium]